MPPPNPLRAEPGWPPAIIGGAFQTGLNLMRDLMRKGVRAVAVDHDITHQGFRSVYGKTYLCPNPDIHPSEWVGFIKNLAQDLGQKPAFIPAADVYIAALGRHGRELADHLLISPEAAELQATICTKEVQYSLTTQHGFPCPRLAYVQIRAELEAFCAGAQFPCLLKPRSPREWEALPEGNPAHGNKIVIVDTASELIRLYDQISPFCPEAIAQEVIQGLGSCKLYYFGVWGKDGGPISHRTMRCVRDYPPFTGMPSVVTSSVDEELLAAAERFLRALHYRGICEFEMKRDSRNNELRLIEINPRFSGTGDSVSYAGLETGWLHYLDMIDFPVQPVVPSGPAFHHIALKIEAGEILPFVLSGKISWNDFLAPYRTRRAYFDLDWHDRRLAVETVTKCLRYASGSIWRYLKGKRV